MRECGWAVRYMREGGGRAIKIGRGGWVSPKVCEEVWNIFRNKVSLGMDVFLATYVRSRRV